MQNTSELYEVAQGLESRVANIRRAKIDLSADEMKRGRRIRDDVLGAVDVLSGVNGFPRLVAGGAFCAGSFGRGTQAQPLDDIDLFFALDAASLEMIAPNGTPTGEALVSRSSDRALGCEQALQNGAWLDSAAVLDRIVPIVCRDLLLRPPPTDCGKNRRGRCAHLSYAGINVDLVFVLWAEHPALDRYLLPGGTSWRWKASNPKEDQRRLSRANQDHHNGLLLPVVRMMKAWNDHACDGRLKGVHLEVLLAEHVFQAVRIDGTVSALAHAFASLPTALQSTCPDPTGLGSDLDVNLHTDDREWVRDRARTSALELTSILSASTSADAAAGQIEELLLTQGPPAPERDQADREPRHDSVIGQPSHRCEDPRKNFYVPPARVEDRPPHRSDQTGRSGQYG